MAVSAPTSGLVGRFRADTLSAVADGANVTSWADSVGTRTVATRTAAPTKLASGANGQPAVRFNGTNQSLGMSNPPVVNQPFTVVTIVRSAVTTSSADRQVFWQGSGGEVQATAAGKWLNYAGAVRTSPQDVTTNPTVITSAFNGAESNSQMFVNGTLALTANVGTGAMDQGLLLIGENSGRWWNGDIYEILFYDHVLSAAERQQVHSYTQDRYAITVSDYSAGGTGTTREQAVAAIPDLHTWLRGDSAPDKTVGNGVSLWDDRGTNNFDATNATTANRPTYVSTPRPGADFPGTSQKMLTSGASTSLAAETIFAVVQPDTVNGYKTIRGADGSGASGGRQFRLVEGKLNWTIQGVSEVVSTAANVSTTALSLVSGSYSTTQALLYINGTQSASGSNPTQPYANRTTRIGAGYDGNENFDGRIYELISFARVLTNGERATVHSYLQDYYGSGQFTVSDYVAEGSADTTAPTVPTNLTASANSPTSVALSWSASTDGVGVSSYRVRRNGSDLATVNAPALAYTDNSAAAGTQYTYTVSAIDAAGNRSAESSSAVVTTPTPDTTAPTVPSNLSALANSATSVALSWTAATDAVGVQSYRVRRNGADLATNVTTTSYTDSNALPSTAYTYTVSAIDAAGNRSAESTSASVTTPTAPAAGRVFDRWNGNALIRIKHERWTGSALVSRILEKYDGVITPDPGVTNPGTSTPARKWIVFGAAPQVRATWETGVNSDGKAQVAWVGSFPDIRSRTSRLEPGVVAQTQDAYQAYVQDLTSNTTVVDSGTVTGTAEKWIATSFTPVAGRRYKGFIRVRASDGQWSSYASTRFVAPTGVVRYLEDFGAVGDGITQSGTDYANQVYTGPIRNALKACNPGDVLRSKAPGTTLTGITASNAALSSANAVFTSVMVNKRVVVYRAGTTTTATNSWAHRTTITAVASDGKGATLASAVSTNGTDLVVLVDYAEYLTGHIDCDNGMGSPGNGGGWTLDGAGCVFISNDPGHSGFRTTIPDTTFKNVHYQQKVTASRGNGKNGDTGPFFVDGDPVNNPTGIRIINCYAERARDAGILIYGPKAVDVHVVDSVADHTNADGFHITGASNNVQFIRCDNAYIGDDGVANIGYRSDGDGSRPYNVVWERPRVFGQDWGRGVSQGGCYNVLVTDLYIERGAGASFILGSDGDMANTSDVQIRRFTIVQPNLRRGQKPTYSQGANTTSTIPDEPWAKIINSSSATQQRDILLEDGVVTDGRYLQIISYGNGAFVDNTITIRNVKMNGTVNTGTNWRDEGTYPQHIDLRGISVPSGSTPITAAPTNPNS